MTIWPRYIVSVLFHKTQKRTKDLLLIYGGIMEISIFTLSVAIF
jgi:hypothetical protein